MKAFLCLLMVAALAASGFGRTVYVSTTGSDSNPGTADQPARTVQWGVNLAFVGDTVLVADGTYTNGGPVLVSISAKDITLKSINGPAKCILDGQQAGRVIDIENGQTPNCVVEGFTIQHGKTTAAVGGGSAAGIYTNNASPTFRNCVIQLNTATNDSGDAVGGGVGVNNGNPMFLNCSITDNSLSSQSNNVFGAGVAVSNGSPTFNHCSIARNTEVTQTGKGYGAGIAFSGGGSPKVIRCTISDNAILSHGSASGTAAGGGIYAISAVPAISRTTVSTNTVTCDSGVTIGGGLYLYDGGSLDACTVSGNTIAGVSNNAFGGGMYATQGTTSLVDSHITDNKVNNVLDGAVGGGLGLAGPATVSMLRCTIARNVLNSDRTNWPDNSGLAGGGVSSAGTLTMSGCTLQENVVQTVNSGIARGGGYSQSAGTSAIKNCLLLGNQVKAEHYTTFGGGAVFTGGTSAVQNTLFVANAILSVANGGGGGFHCAGSGVTVRAVNCDFVGNNGGGGGNAGGGAVSCWNSGAVTVANCILRGNTASQDSELSSFSSTIAVSYSDVQGGLPSGVTNGGHNIDAEPQFVRPPLTNGATDYGDLHLSFASPAHDAGNAAAPGILPFDMDGNPRKQGSAPDMGAYEVVQGLPIVYAFYVDAAAGNDSNSGTSSAPFKTVTKALAMCDPLGRASLYIKQGNYGSDRPKIVGLVKFANWTGAGRASIGKS